MMAGALDQRITLQQRSAAKDAAGQRVQAWSDVAEVWASVRVKSARDFEAAAADQASSLISVRIRQRPGVSGTMRISWRGVAYDIVGEPGLVDRQWLQFDAASGVRDARQ
jgi:SPP1 family predicted phage head-tail adaptor